MLHFLILLAQACTEFMLAPLVDLGSNKPPKKKKKTQVFLPLCVSILFAFFGYCLHEISNSENKKGDNAPCACASTAIGITGKEEDTAPSKVVCICKSSSEKNQASSIKKRNKRVTHDYASKDNRAKISKEPLPEIKPTTSNLAQKEEKTEPAQRPAIQNDAIDPAADNFKNTVEEPKIPSNTAWGANK